MALNETLSLDTATSVFYDANEHLSKKIVTAAVLMGVGIAALTGCTETTAAKPVTTAGESIEPSPEVSATHSELSQEQMDQVFHQCNDLFGQDHDKYTTLQSLPLDKALPIYKIAMSSEAGDQANCQLVGQLIDTISANG